MPRTSLPPRTDDAQSLLPPQPISLHVLRDKYLQPDEASVGDVYDRVARALASVESPALKSHYERTFRRNLEAGGIGAGRIMHGAGTRSRGTLLSCFVQPIGDCLQGYDEDGRPGIDQALHEAAETMRRGGGVGYDFSRIRPEGSSIQGSAATATAPGPCHVMDRFDRACGAIESIGARRGAQMGVLRIDHPDVEAFIVAKRTPGRWRNFNVSVGVTDAFIHALEDDREWALTHRATPSPAQITDGAHPGHDGRWVYRSVPARALWNLIMQSAYDCAEPGVLFLDRIEADNNLREIESITATNPCVTADTSVMTDRGPRRVADLIGRPFTAVVNGTSYPVESAGFFFTGTRPVMEVRTREGLHVRLTAEHRVRTVARSRNGTASASWTPAAKLRPGDRILRCMTPSEGAVDRPPMTATVIAVAPLGEEAVYEVRVSGVHAFDANGLLVHNCGEQPLPSYGCCALGPIILTRFVDNPFSMGGSARFDFEAFAECVTVQVRALDNTLDLSDWPLPQQRAEAKAKRRIGVGWTGLGDTLVMLGLPYNSEAGRAMAARIARCMRDSAYLASVNLAIEKGPFPLFDARHVLAQGTFASRLPQPIQRKIRAHGLRNSHLLSIAPTGSVSLAFADNCSAGIEPAFAWTYTRTIRQSDGSHQTYTVEDHAYRRYVALDGDPAHLPEAFVSAQDMSADDHIAMMRAVQPYIDASISKTVNVAANYPFEDFKHLYLRAWHAGLKGLATYRRNAIVGAVMEATPKRRAAPSVRTQNR